MKFFDGSVARFLLAGTLNTGATYAVYLLLLQVAPYAIAFSISFVAGILLSYALNARFVFRRRTAWHSFLRFPLIYLVQYLIAMLLVALCVERLGIAPWLAPLLCLVVTIPMTYVLARAVFNRPVTR